MTHSIVAVTSYFNPFRGELRRQNFRCFRHHLGIPLVAVEWSHNGQFDLQQGDADVLIQIAGGDILWQKERLLNIGLVHARSLSRNLAILDSDILFGDPDWAKNVIAALEKFPLIQCFSQVDYLPPTSVAQGSREFLRTIPREMSLPSIAVTLADNQPLYCRRPTATPLGPAHEWSLSGNPGMAYALRTDLMPSFTFYEGNIVGAGDMIAAAAACGQLNELFQIRPYTAQHQADIHRWAEKHFTAPVRLGYADNRLLHMWHGTLQNRRYMQRGKLLIDCNYDPARDIVQSEDGALKFSPGAHILRETVFDYLGSRRDS